MNNHHFKQKKSKPLLNNPFDQPQKTFQIPPGKAGIYRVAQWDDYTQLKREYFYHSPPLRMTLRARVGRKDLPGTWGFGFWNDPFGIGLGIKGAGARLPALPEAVWFFYASPKCDLSFRENEPRNGLLASVFTSSQISPLMLPLGIPVIPMLAIKPIARWLRKFAAKVIQEDSIQLKIDPREWHTYHLDWLAGAVQFFVDGKTVFTTRVSPKPPLGLVIWIDNQYAAFSADGTVRFGLEENTSDSWMELEDFSISPF